MKSITAKIIAISFISLLVASIVPNILSFVISGSFGRDAHMEDITPISMIIVGGSTAFIAVSVFGLGINQLILKRVKGLNDATQDVIKGNFDTTVEEVGHDEISQLVRNFNQMTEELNSNEYLNKEFVRNFSHELKTPLSAIKGYAELLNSHEMSEEERLEYTNIIINESSRLSNLSKNMLLISQVDSQMIIPKTDTYNITEQLRNIIQLMQLEWEMKQLHFELNVNEVKVTSNKELTYQVFSNLLSNAIEFAPEESTIHVKLYEDDETINFEIINKGELTEEECKQVFDLFYIKEKSRSTKSNGVGLSLTKKIVEKIDGNIEAFSNINTVTFKLLLKKQD